MDLQVGDRVKVLDTKYTKSRNLAGRYGHIVELSDRPDNYLEARIAFNDFQQWIPTEHLQKCKTN